MKTIVKTASALAVASLLGASLTPSAFAADDAPKKGGRDRFTTMDADKDGKVTLEEYSAVMAKSKKEPKPTAEEIGKSFKRLDKDKNDSLSKEELAAPAKKKDGAKPKTDA